MKAVAEATVNELKSRLTGRDKELAELHALLEATKAQWLAQHQTDREEIGRLNQALFERNNASIDNLKVGVYGGGGSLSGNGVACMRTYMLLGWVLSCRSGKAQ